MESPGVSVWPRERIAVAAYFALLGFVCATWASSIDDMKVLLDLDKASLGRLLLSGPLGNLVSFTFASALVTRLGSRRSVVIAMSAYLSSALYLAVCYFLRLPVPYWCVGIGAFSASGNLVNISVNTQAGIVERRAGRTIMNSFHGMFSLMFFAGGLLALFASIFAVPVYARFAVVLVLSVAAHLFFAGRLPQESDAVSAEASRRWHRPDATLVALGLAALVIMGSEGAVNDWVGVFYRESLTVPESRVKWGFCAVSALMAVGRFVTDGFINRFGPSRVLHVHALLVALGLGWALATPFLGFGGLSLQVAATCGFGVAGYGIAALMPIVYSRVNRTKAMPAGSAITFVGSVGFLGYFIGPPLIGQVSEHVNLSVALGIFAVLILACLFVNPERD